MKDRKLTAPEMGRISAGEYRSKNDGGTVVVLDNVRSAYNVGSAFRSADAFGVAKLCLCGISAAPPSAEIHKTALGAEEAVPWERYANTLDAVAALKADGYTVVSVEQTEQSVKLVSEGVIPSETVSLRSTPPFAKLTVPPLTMPRVARVSEGTLPPNTNPSPKYAFIFGNEVEGVQQSVVDASDFCLEIPQHGTKHSLNVAVTVGIVLFALTPAR